VVVLASAVDQLVLELVMPRVDWVVMLAVLAVAVNPIENQRHV
jgi:hypothetical protein